MLTRLALALFVSFAASAHAADPALTRADLEEYNQCSSAAAEEDFSVAEVVKLCLEPARKGIPGAQYALGVGLLTRNEGNDRTEGLQWLERSSASGNPAAMLALAGVLLGEQSPASVERGRTLLRQSICSGHPLAVELVEKQGFRRDQADCPKRADEDFTGDWIADLRWVKIDPPMDGGPSLKFSFAGGGAVQVFMKSGSDWREVKPGSFKVNQVQQSLTISSLDSGWDFDGLWIESWSVHFLRTTDGDAVVSFLRNVNNPHVPASVSFRTFSTLAEGKAVRASSP